MQDSAMLPNPEDTIVALSSAPGPGSAPIIRLTGSRALQIARTVFHAEESIAPDQRRRYDGALRLPALHSPLPADLYVAPAPRTYTGQELVEIHTISGPPLIDLLIATLLSAGARAAQAGEFTLRAFLAGKLDLRRPRLFWASFRRTTGINCGIH